VRFRRKRCIRENPVLREKVYQALISERINTISSDMKERIGYRLMEDPMF
jgi:hypothetical protein